MAKREQLGEEGQNDNFGHGDFSNNGKRTRGDGNAVGMILTAAGQPTPQHPRRPFMAFSGTRHTRVGADYQVTQLPSPSMSSITTTSSASVRSVDKDEPALPP